MRTAVLSLLGCLGLLAQSFTIRNVTVIDSEGARSGQTVVVRGERIAAVTRASSASGAGQSIDGRGKFLIPALWDMHVHLWDEDPMLGLYVASGVLGVRDMGSDLVRTRKLMAGVAARRLPGPRIFTSGPALGALDSGIKPDFVIDCPDPNRGREAVDKVERGSADFVRIRSNISPDTYRAIAQRARVIRMPFAGELPDGVTALEAIEARQKSIEHMSGIPMACTPLEIMLREQRDAAAAKQDQTKLQAIRTRVYETFSPGAANDLFHRMARWGVWQTPTLTMWQRMTLRHKDPVDNPDLRYIPDLVRNQWKLAENDPTPERRAELSREYEFHAKLAHLIATSGAGVLAGTNTGDPWVVPGLALHDELQALVEAGYGPLEALNTATINPARYFSLEGTHGTIAKGKVADMILLSADPLADIRNTRKITAVIQGGRLHPRKCLDSLLEGKQCSPAPATRSRGVRRS